MENLTLALTELAKAVQMACTDGIKITVEMQGAIPPVTSAKIEPAAEEKPAEKPKTRRKKAEPKEEPKTESEPEPKEEPKPKAEPKAEPKLERPEKAEPEVSKEDLRNLLMKVRQTWDSDELLADIFARCGVKTLRQLPEEMFGRCYEVAEKALKDGAVYASEDPLGDD